MPSQSKPTEQAISQLLQLPKTRSGKIMRRLLKAQELGRDEVRDAVLDYLNWETVANSAEAILRAMDLEQRYQISFWDAMIVQAAESAACEVLYSEDLSHGQEYGGVLVVNPFLS